MDQSLVLPVSGIFHQFSRIADPADIVGNQVIAMANHVLIGMDDSDTSWDTLQPIRIERIVKSGRQFQRFGGIVVWQQQRQPDFGMTLFCFSDGLSGEPVKAAISPDNEFCDALFGDVSLHRLLQFGKD